MAEEILISDNAIKRLKDWIITAENVNIRTRNKNDAQMVKAIMQRIEEEANAAAIN